MDDGLAPDVNGNAEGGLKMDVRGKIVYLVKNALRAYGKDFYEALCAAAKHVLEEKR